MTSVRAEIITRRTYSRPLDENGEVLQVVLKEPVEARFSEPALYEVRNWWDFSPGFKEGQPISSEHRATVVYRILEQ